MLFFKPSFVKLGQQFVKDARKLLAYKRDIATPEAVSEVEAEIASLESIIRTKDQKKIETQMIALDESCGRLARPTADASLRENIEVFLVAIVIALGVRTYFLQPFTIPTGSMQPTLNGIIGYRTAAPSPNVFVQAIDFALHGRTYVDVVAKQDEVILDGYSSAERQRNISEVTRYGFFTYTRIRADSGNVYYVKAPEAAVRNQLLDQGKSYYKSGESIVRGYVDTGDHVFVDKFTYNFRSPHRGEVFVFSTQNIPKITARTPNHQSQYYIKRLAGLPGDTLRIDPPNLFLNGKRATEFGFERVMAGTRTQPHDGYMGYSNGPDGYTFDYLGSPAAIKVLEPKNYFALGDNSYHSADSRDWGTVPEQNIMGRAIMVYWPFIPHFGFIR